jgi:nucleoside-diphosphate-sugar epimerase
MSYWENRKVLVGGGCGFLGSYLVPLLVERSARVTVVDNMSNGDASSLAPVLSRIELVEGDLRDADFCERATRGHDVVINLAAKAFGMAYSQAHNGEMLVYNLQSSLTPLEAARTNGVGHFVVVSSSCVYPDDAPVPTPELDVFTGLPEQVNEGYGWAKRIDELAGTYYARESSMKVTIVRPFNPYGSHYRWGSEDKAHVVPSLVKRILDREDPVVIWGSGRQRRNFLHASDAAELMLLVAEKEAGPEPVNIGYEEDTSIADLVAMICEVSGFSPVVQFDTSKPEGRFRKCAQADRLRSLTGGYVPTVSLRDGIEDMMSWYARAFRSGST